MMQVRQKYIYKIMNFGTGDRFFTFFFSIYLMTYICSYLRVTV